MKFYSEEVYYLRNMAKKRFLNSEKMLKVLKAFVPIANYFFICQSIFACFISFLKYIFFWHLRYHALGISYIFHSLTSDLPFHNSNRMTLDKRMRRLEKSEEYFCSSEEDRKAVRKVEGINNQLVPVKGQSCR